MNDDQFLNSSDSFGLPAILQSQVDAELQPGEQILWREQPVPSRMARSVWPLVAFGVPWTAFAVFWVFIASMGSMCFGLFGLPFIVVGIGMLTSPFWMSRMAAKTVYVITNQRAIIFKSGILGGMTVRSFEPARLTDLQRKQYADGTGNLIFSRTVRRDMDGDRHVTTVGFMAVRDVKAVEDRVRELVRQHEKT